MARLNNYNIAFNREKLSGGLKIVEEIAKLEENLSEVRQGKCSASSTNEKIKGGIKLSPQESIFELENKIDILNQNYKIETKINERLIEDIQGISETEREFLYNRFVRCLPWENVRQLSGYKHISTTMRKANKILSKFKLN